MKIKISVIYIFKMGWGLERGQAASPCIQY